MCVCAGACDCAFDFLSFDFLFSTLGLANNVQNLTSISICVNSIGLRLCQEERLHVVDRRAPVFRSTVGLCLLVIVKIGVHVDQQSQQVLKIWQLHVDVHVDITCYKSAKNVISRRVR